MALSAETLQAPDDHFQIISDIWQINVAGNLLFLDICYM